ncbi:MAG TPA: site-specific integrase [Pseudomonas sabulinigri]|uniref:Tyr recombinase domain-containing protein n=1 Tax=marine sediment metagenome TaxID=412755 RepID=A0A0F9V3W1_9ZZZZ|nr:site-specific integrase [Halopseudomonas sabulinigri]HEC51467.1 site-specific integrase [Halopseudomonas sabulinigri]
MSNLSNQQHLITSPSGVYQYYLTLPKYLSSNPRLPAQIRWSLGRDAALARTLARLLDAELSLILKPGATLITPELVRERLTQANAWLKRTLDNARNPWGTLPTPAELAQTDLSIGKRRLVEDSAKRATLFSHTPGGELILSIRPSQTLQLALDLQFDRLDWPLGITDHAQGQDAAVYAFAAVAQLEQHTPNAGLRHPATFHALALYEYLCYARPDGGAALSEIPTDLPGSLAAFRIHSTLTSLSWPTPKKSAFFTRQLTSGLYRLEMTSCALKDQYPILATRSFQLTLPTTSAIVATLLKERLVSAVESTLHLNLRRAATETSLAQAHQQLEGLVSQLIGSALEKNPLPSLPQARPLTEESSTPVDPAKQALASALSALLPEAERAQLDALINGAKGITIESKAEQLNGITLGELAKRFEQAQVNEGNWTHVKTLPMCQARLATLTELLGSHKRLKALRRADFLTLRDQLRNLPKNARQIALQRRLSLPALVTDRTSPAVHPRTAKSYFELAKAMMRYALDEELVEYDVTSNLLFKTRNASPPTNRTYSHEMLVKLINSPAYSSAQPRWRLDDYKFWLPLLGLYTGARLAELCQLRLTDIRCCNGIWIINIDDADGKRVKNAGSVRQVPIHHQLIKLGFLDFINSRKRAKAGGKALLFDSLRLYRALPDSHVASRWFGFNKERSGLADDNATFHGLRHTFIHQFRVQRLDILIAKALVGHVDNSTTGGYGDIYPLSVLKEEIDKLDFELDLTHISYERYQAMQERQGSRQIGRPPR